mmetsp:Transcript_59118/g.152009  ORF Transcript_59118/g.152009 Transcript_59118/m.152009 type:complete len:239 (-) Transcript_59118:131-847(-)
MLSLLLLLTTLAKLHLRLLPHVLHDVHDAAAVRLVGLGGRRAELVVAVVRVRLLLDQGSELLAILGRDAGSINDGAQPDKDGVQAASGHRPLHERGATLLGLLLEDLDGPAQHVDGLQQLALGGLEGGSLGLADIRGVLELILVGRDQLRQLLDLDGGLVALTGGALDLGFEFGLLLRGNIHRRALLGGRVITPLEVLLVGCLRHLPILADGCLELGDQPNGLLHRVQASGRCGVEAE